MRGPGRFMATAPLPWGQILWGKRKEGENLRGLRGGKGL